MLSEAPTVGAQRGGDACGRGVPELSRLPHGLADRRFGGRGNGVEPPSRAFQTRALPTELPYLKQRATPLRVFALGAELAGAVATASRGRPGVSIARRKHLQGAIGIYSNFGSLSEKVTVDWTKHRASSAVSGVLSRIINV